MIEAIAKVITDAVRTILFMLDQIVYGFIPTLYKLIVSIANVDLYSNNPAIAALLNRVYIIVGIFMLFKLAFSILRYIVDPGSFSDNAKGFSGLIKSVLVALILLVSIPFVFSKIYEYQGKILDSKIIPNLILGTSDNGSDDLESNAVDLQFTMFGPFFALNTNDGVSEFEACKPDPNDKPLSDIIGSTDMALKDGCLDAFVKVIDNDDTVKASGVTIDKFFKTEGSDVRNFNSLGSLLTLSTSSGEYAVNYTPIISTICGGYLAFLLLSFCIDIAVRAIKLMFLQLLSPIAVISSIDPGSSSQNERLKDWGMECLKTYISLFLRLIVIYTVIQVVKVVTSKLFAGSESLYYSGFKDSADATLNIWVYIFLILGAFSVAKKIPELLEKAFGIKFSGEISMNPFKSFSENAGFGFLAGAATGGLAGAVSGGISAFSTSLNQDKGLGRSLASAVGGAASGGFTGTFRGTRAKGFKGWEAGSQSGGRIARRMEVRAATGGIKGVPGMAMDRMRDKFGAPTTYESMEAKAKRYDDVVSGIDAVKKRATSELSTKNNAWKTIQAQKTQYEQLLRNGGQIDNETAVQRMKEHENSVIEKNKAFNDLNREFNSSTYQSMDKTSEAYIKKQQEVAAARAAYQKARADYDHWEDVYTKGDMTDEMYVDLQNAAYQQEQQMIADYINGNAIKDASGNITGYRDAELALNMQSLEKTIHDTHDEQLQSIGLENWQDIGGDGNKQSIKSKANNRALGIRSEPGYNDAHDRHQAIHGARLDAHQKH